jgi:hypothetical protein
MRDRLLETLSDVRYRRFLVYVMGPYKAFGIGDVADGQSPFPEWDDAASEFDEADVQALLERTRDRLRDEVGVNAFLAIDAEIPLDEMDAATQTIEFARASNAVVFVAPSVGKNLGVGIEIGSVMEALDETQRERVVFVHEAGVRSAMIDGLSRRWDATILTYETEDELFDQLRQFVVQVMNAEFTGELPDLDD